MILRKQLLAIYSLFIFIALFIVWVAFKDIPKDNFLFMGDQFFRFTLHETLVNSFFIRKPENLNVFNAWQQMTQVWDFTYYLFVYSLGISFITAEKILFFIVIFFSQVFAFHGFSKIQHIFFKNKYSVLSTIVITLWYCFNPYTLELWHGGVYNIGLGLSYSLTPLLFAYFYSSIFFETNLKNIFITALLLFVCSFVFWLFAVTVFFLGIYCVLHYFYFRPSLKLVLHNILLLGSVYMLLSLPIIYSITHELTNNVGDNNGSFAPAYGNQKGGLIYQLMMLFSWGIYNIWHPRTMYPFHNFFFSAHYIFSIITLYIVLIVGILVTFSRKILKRHSPIITIFILIFLSALFLAKGAQPPFGWVFEFMYNYVPFFSVFRTPDLRFGFLIVFSVSMLFIFITPIYKKWIFITILLGIITIQNIYFLNGIVFKGLNIENKFYDRVLFVPKDYQEVIRFLNSSSSIDKYILPIPSEEYGKYTYDGEVFNIGPDIISKFIHHPFIYISETTGINTKTYSLLKASVENQEYTTLNQFPIKYILLRKDLKCETCQIDEAKLSIYFKKVYSNNTFKLYEAKKYQPLIASKNSTYATSNPVTHTVTIKNVNKAQPLQLALSYNPHWKIFIEPNNESDDANKTATLNISDIKYLFKKPIFANTHSTFNSYGNEWQIDAQTIKNNYAKDFYTANPDGSVSVRLKIIYVPQLYYQLFVAISLITITTCLGYIVIKKKILVNTPFKRFFISIAIFSLSIFFITYHIFTADYSFPTLTEGYDVNNFSHIPDKELLKGDSITASFTSSENYLGIVLLHFNNFDRMNADLLRFSIREKGTEKWYYQYDYNSAAFYRKPLFPFGFPPIKDSKNKKYEIKIESLAGRKDSAVGVDTNHMYTLYTKYQYPQPLILQDKNSFRNFFSKKIQNLYEYHNLAIYSLLYLLPFISYILSFFYLEPLSKLIYKLILKSKLLPLLEKTQSGREIIAFFSVKEISMQNRLIFIGFFIVTLETFLSTQYNVILFIIFSSFLIISSRKNPIIKYLLMCIFFLLPIMFLIRDTAAEKFSMLIFVYALFFIAQLIIKIMKAKNKSFY